MTDELYPLEVRYKKGLGDEGFEGGCFVEVGEDGVALDNKYGIDCGSLTIEVSNLDFMISYHQFNEDAENLNSSSLERKLLGKGIISDKNSISMFGSNSETTEVGISIQILKPEHTVDYELFRILSSKNNLDSIVTEQYESIEINFLVGSEIFSEIYKMISNGDLESLDIVMGFGGEHSFKGGQRVKGVFCEVNNSYYSHFESKKYKILHSERDISNLSDVPKDFLSGTPFGREFDFHIKSKHKFKKIEEDEE